MNQFAGHARAALPRFVLILALGAGAAGLLLAAAGCGVSAFDTAKLTEGALARGYTTVTAAWFDYDHKHQLELVNGCRSDPHPQDCARAAVDDWRTKVQARVIEGLKASGLTLKAFGDALDDAGAAARKDWSGVAGPAVAAWSDLAQLLKLLNVPIPVPTIGG